MNGLYFQRIGRGNRPPHVVTLDFTDIEQRVLDALRAPYRVLSLNEVHFLFNLDKDWETPVLTARRELPAGRDIGCAEPLVKHTEEKNMINEKMREKGSDHQALLDIQELMDGVNWSPDTLSAIADVLENAGYRVRDTEE